MSQFTVDLKSSLNKGVASPYGIYCISSKELRENKLYKVGKGVPLYSRLNSYFNCWPLGFQVDVLLVIESRGKTQSQKKLIANAEKSIFSKLHQFKTNLREFPTRVEIVTDELNDIIKIFRDESLKIEGARVMTNLEDFNWDDKLYIVEKIIDERLSDDGKETEYLIKWKNFAESQNSWLPKRDLVGTDAKGSWINGELKKYLISHKKIPKSKIPKKKIDNQYINKNELVQFEDPPDLDSILDDDQLENIFNKMFKRVKDKSKRR